MKLNQANVKRGIGVLAVLSVAFAGCDDGDGETAGEVHIPDHYEFESRFEPVSSVSYAGQVHRHLLIHDLAGAVGTLTERIDGGWMPAEGDVVAELSFYLDFDSEVGAGVTHGFAGDVVQGTYGEVSSKNLVAKLAGNDSEGQHADWSTDFVGWSADGVTTPESLVRRWIEEVDRLAVARASGDVVLDPSGAPVAAAYVSAEGLDYQQLLQKFLLGAVAFSQGADDYLDDASLESSDNVEPREPGKPSTTLEHHWDEGFGYFGAARDFGDYSDAENAESAVHDSDGDGQVDLLTEVSWGHARNAAKRDNGSHPDAPTDFSGDAWHGLCAGRALIREAGGALGDGQLAELRRYRDQVVGAWEGAIAATVVHYINDVLQDMAAGDAYDFAGHAKHWSELKGFALSLQFNPRSAVSDTDFVRLHALIGQAPVLPGGDLDGYAADLLEARALIGAAYGFDALNLGDDAGENGW